MTEKLTDRFLMLLSLKTELDDEKYEKIRYITNIFIREFLDMILFLIMFSIAGCCMEYLIALLTVMSTRTFAGGMHEKTKRACFIHSMILFSCSVIIAKYIPVSVLFGKIIFLTSAILFLVYAPIIPATRGRFSRKKCFRMKSFSLMGLCFLWMLSIVKHSLWVIIVSTLMLLNMEYIIQIHREGGRKNVGDN